MLVIIVMLQHWCTVMALEENTWFAVWTFKILKRFVLERFFFVFYIHIPSPFVIK